MNQTDLRLDKTFLDERRSDYQTRIDGMINYLHSEQQCRSRKLVQYFGESMEEDCGVCDSCVVKKRTRMTTDQFAKSADFILSIIQDNPLLATAAIVEKSGLSSETAKEVLYWLLDMEKVKRDEFGRFSRQ